MDEKKIIEKIIGKFEKSHLHLNNFYESDAEVFDHRGNKMLFTMDEFSSEDLFREVNPVQLGKNLAIATISDIFASGGDPMFYAHSMSVPKNWSEDFILNLSSGIS